MGGSEKGGQRTAFPGRSLCCWHLPWKAGGCSHVQMWRGQPRALLYGEGRGFLSGHFNRALPPFGSAGGSGKKMEHGAGG